MTRIGLIRHGLTDWNHERRAQGQSDIPLNQIGRIQARALADRLKREQWDFIFSSDLSRAKETADIVANHMGLIVQTDPRLREMHKGETEGTTLEERIHRWGNQWETLPLGIEDNQSIIQRGTSFITEIAETFQQHIHNTSITILNQHRSYWDCESFNCAIHIEK